MASTTKKPCEKTKAPKTCSPEQIKQCHGDTPMHTCGKDAKKPEK